ncbi:hypothetical protein LTR28_011658 [Elasticomyces elasticus]|nr:hypothetical protein LTR28_011658 [Elasticomyces elasticus]
MTLPHGSALHLPTAAKGAKNGRMYGRMGNGSAGNGARLAQTERIPTPASAAFAREGRETAEMTRWAGFTSRQGEDTGRPGLVLFRVFTDC